MQYFRIFNKKEIKKAQKNIINDVRIEEIKKILSNLSKTEKIYIQK